MTRDPNVRLLATDGTTGWELWRLPDLRGRIAYDVRFELYDQATLDRIIRYDERRAAGTGRESALSRRRDPDRRGGSAAG